MEHGDSRDFARHLDFLAGENISRPFDVSTSGHPLLKFVTHQQLMGFWKPARIKEILRNNPECEDITPEAIRAGYIRIFSLLVQCGRTNQLPAFISNGLDDNRFYLEPVPDSFATQHHLEELFRAIAPLQWVYFPLVIHPDRIGLQVEPPKRILPILHEEEIAKGAESTVYKARLHPECCVETLSRGGTGQVGLMHGFTSPPPRTGLICVTARLTRDCIGCCCSQSLQGLCEQEHV